eukprot:CAMPEP_0198576970 /NCGR_PEP_ID=MMETSP1462-20131121/118297_1 /TAXON_ID=1333877 /ORGANISM="Brandtodinium nutriculum, Strain RCC3387" /LENGTH=802 /DNA_ID=CAMNT_0044308241 /DNA_START=15 /DNA_END=2420 /DNA_ORIENTATION=+
MAQPSPFGDDQDRLLDEASAVVKEQAFYLKRAIDSDSTREALKHASNMICELRTSLLSPKNYYELYMQVFQEMQHLHGYFCDPGRHGRKMVDLYESVQHAGNILPRLYLLATVGSAYIKSKEAPAKEILKDVGELCKGVQHPLRGLFLRYYVSQMMKDKVPDVGSGYEGEGGDMDDAFDAIFSNFMESNRLWVRIQSQGPLRDKSKREKERHDLRVLVGANLVRLSQLDGMSLEYYTNQALPKILDHIISVKDTMSQQYFFESMIQVFGDEFHLNTLEQLLTAYAKAQPTVDMKPIVVALMTRLANYLTESEGGKDMLAGTDVFSLFRTHLNHILERALTPAATGGGAPAAPASPDLGPCLEIQAAFMSFTNSLYPGKVHYVDLILGSTVDMLRRHAVGGDLGGSAQRVADLLACPIKTLSMAVLEMEHYPLLLDFLDFSMRKQVALSFVNGITEDNHPLTNLDAVNSLFKFITPLITDMRDTPGNYYASDPENFVHEQQCVAKLAHQIRCEDMDSCLQMVTAMRGFFGQGGPQRMTHTLPAAFHAAMSLIPRLRALDARRAEGEEDLPVPAVTPKKVFQFMHKTVSAFQTHAPEVAIQLWLVAAGAANIADSGSPGVFDQICYEFLTQAIMCFEEELSETVKQFAAVHTIVGTLTQITCLNQENYDAVSEKITLHAAKLLKKPMQCRAVAACSHLYWCSSRRDGRRVLECLQKCLKVTDAHVQSDASSVGLWVEMLDKYVYYCDHDVEEVQITFIQSLLNLCQEHISYAEKDPSSAEDAKKAKAHWNQTVACLRDLKASPE